MSPKAQNPMDILPLAAAELPDDLSPLSFDEAEVLPRNQRGSVINVQEPARGNGSAAARVLLGRAAMENSLGTQRPAKVITGVDSKKTKLYLGPVEDTENPDAIEVAYPDSGFVINLYKPFRRLNRLVSEGFREVYQCGVTESPVKIGNFIGYAIYIKLNKPKREPVHELPEEKKKQMREKRAAKKKTPAPAAPPAADET